MDDYAVSIFDIHCVLPHYNVHKLQYIFTTGLSTAASLDILITAALCYYIRRGRSGFGR